MLGLASLNNLSVAWVSRWGSHLNARAWASLSGFVLLLLRTQSCLFHNPYPPYSCLRQFRSIHATSGLYCSGLIQLIANIYQLIVFVIDVIVLSLFNCLISSTFYEQLLLSRIPPECAIRHWWLDCLFPLLGSSPVKAALVKRWWNWLQGTVIHLRASMRTPRGTRREWRSCRRCCRRSSPWRVCDGEVRTIDLSPPDKNTKKSKFNHPLPPLYSLLLSINLQWKMPLTGLL